MSLESEYKELSLADLTDDITIDPVAWRTREERIIEIIREVGDAKAFAWEKDVVKQAKEVGYASGAVFV
jgi:hypothetical protein